MNEHVPQFALSFSKLQTDKHLCFPNLLVREGARAPSLIFHIIVVLLLLLGILHLLHLFRFGQQICQLQV